MDLKKLHEIDEQLTKAEVAALKFLCMDHLGRKRLETVRDAKDLFIQFSEQDLFANELFLVDLLYTIGRCDLLAILETDKTHVSRLLENNHSGVSLYRKMLYKLSENATDENLHNMKFFLSNLPKAKLASASFLEVLAEMEKMGMLGEDNLEELEKVLRECSKELADKVKTFRNASGTSGPGDRAAGPKESLVSVSQEEENVCPQIQDEPMHDVQNLSIADTTTPQTGFSSASERVDTDSQESSYSEDDCYPMTQRPLGHCLIINNHEFLQSTRLKSRSGTDADKDALTKVFNSMHFLVEERRDCSGVDMKNAAKEFSSRDHSEMNAFVCCVLSHGEKGTVLGVDGAPVEIRELFQPFAHCLTLLGKPKLFFIQACQGNELQKGVWRQDGTEDEAFEEDAIKGSGLSRVPVEADFLIGMATVESYRSFRHTVNGSVFIQALCRHLSEGCRNKEDILSILTRVNRSVSAEELNNHKQMPEPRYTLTKKLVLPLD